MPAWSLLFVEIVGTIAFAISGAMLGLEKKMDIFGISILGLVTAVGGGVIRDLVLGLTPPNVFRNPVYALIAIGVSMIVFLPFVRRLFSKIRRLYDFLIFFMDSLGLGIFTVVGVRTAYNAGFHGMFLLLFVGVITGVGGGILRDVMAGNTPYVFVKHFYACASLIGAFVCILLWSIAGETLSMAVGAAVILVLRFLAAHFHWELPKASL
jgi:uncharacterized membrane protein YeiH